MSTRVYGCSDDLVEVKGDVSGEVGHYEDDDGKGVLLVFSDGTLLVVKYGKPGNSGIWGVTLVKAGGLFQRIETCEVEDADPYSDQAFFADGLKWAYAAKDWERVK